MRSGGNPALPRFADHCFNGWARVRALWQGVKLAKVSVISVLFGLAMFALVPQAQDLFLEVRGSFARGTAYWVFFYLAVTVGWVLPVYISSRWILTKFEGDLELGPHDRHLPVSIAPWVRHALPPLLAALCFVAVLAGQFMALTNAPVSLGGDAVSGTVATCSTAEGCGPVAYVGSLLERYGQRIAQAINVERSLVIAYAFCVVIAFWILQLTLLDRFRVGVWHRSARLVWWLVAGLVMLPMAIVAASVFYGLTKFELGPSLNVSHVIVLPLATIILGCIAWWGLRWQREGRPTHFANLLLMLTRYRGRADQSAATQRLLSPVFFAVLQISVAFFLVLLVTEPAQLTRALYRALLIPALLGMFVAPLTYLGYWSTQLRAPLILATVVAIAGATAFLRDSHDVRVTVLTAERPTLRESIERWAKVNGCELKTSGTGQFTAQGCPQPIIVSAAGGASRAAFLNTAFMGKLLDESVAAIPEGHDEDIAQVSFAGDGSRILSASGPSIRLWDAATGDETAAFELSRTGVRVWHLSKDGRRLLTMGDDTTVRLWDTETGQSLGRLGKSSWRSDAVSLSPDDTLVAVVVDNKRVRIFDAETGRPEFELAGGESAKFSPDSSRIVTSSPPQVWDSRTGAALTGALPEPEAAADRFRDAMFSPDGARILVENLKGARIFDRELSLEIARILPEQSIRDTTFNADGRRILATADSIAVAWLLDGETGAEIARLASAPEEEVQASRFVSGVAAAFNKDGSRIVTHSSDDGAVLWDGVTGRRIAALKHPEDSVFDSKDAVFSHNGEQLVTYGSLIATRLWDARDGRFAAALPKDANSARSAAFAPRDDAIVATTGRDAHIWQPGTAEPISNFKVVASDRRTYRANGAKLRPFSKQLFAISAVSGGALSAVVTYAALADSQTQKRATNGLGKPPCVVDAHTDGQWFAPYVLPNERNRPDNPRDPSSAAWKPHESWRGCLEVILAGDFLSPVAASLFSSDLLQLHFRGDRAAVLEKAWELRYAQMTGQNTAATELPYLIGVPSKSTLDDPILLVRERVLKENPSNWLPVLLLNGTSVTTGRRIIASDTATITEPSIASTDDRFARIMTDAYDFHKLVQEGIDDQSFNAKLADIRLSTGATLSARFPIISPHGGIRHQQGFVSRGPEGAEGQLEAGEIVDRVVDGGYYENFGATTSLELATELRRYGLDPFIIVVNNDPSLRDMDCVTKVGRLTIAKAPQSLNLSTLSSPLLALLATGTGRATLAAVQACTAVGEENFAFITVRPDEHNPDKALSMSWWLSMHVQKFLDDQLDIDGINRSALRRIVDVRTDKPHQQRGAAGVTPASDAANGQAPTP